MQLQYSIQYKHYCILCSTSIKVRHTTFILSGGTYSADAFNAKAMVAVWQQKQDWEALVDHVRT